MRVSAFDGSRRAAVIVAAASAMLVSACGDTVPTVGPVGAMRGTALAGPTCPVERPGDPSCVARPVVGIVEFRQNDRLIATRVIDATGGFTAELPVGTYTVSVNAGTKPFPTCAPTELTIAAATTATVDVRCDTGIR